MLRKKLDTGSGTSNDAIYSGYIAVFENLDNLLWKQSLTLTTYATLGFGATGYIYTNDLSIYNLGKNYTALLASIVVLSLISLGLYTIERMRLHRLIIANELFRLSDEKYFSGKWKNGKWYLSASYIQRIVFISIGVFNVTLSLVNISGPVAYLFLVFIPITSLLIESRQDE